MFKFILQLNKTPIANLSDLAQQLENAGLVKFFLCFQNISGNRHFIFNLHKMIEKKSNKNRKLYTVRVFKITDLVFIYY